MPIPIIEKGSAVLFNGVTVLAVVMGAVVYFARLEPTMTELDHKVADVRTAQTEASARVDRIEESRSADAQRLSRAEEALVGVKEVLAKIDAKVDRLLMRR